MHRTLGGWLYDQNQGRFSIPRLCSLSLFFFFFSQIVWDLVDMDLNVLYLVNMRSF